jgi:hypothetical protein
MTKRITSFGLITRRETLEGCLAGVIACGLAFDGSAATRDSGRSLPKSRGCTDTRRRTDLYAFRAKEPGRMAVALVWAQDPTGHKTETRLHIGDRTWTSHDPSSGNREVLSESDGVRTYSGRIVEDAAGDAVALDALLVEGPSARLASRGIWAERLGGNGSRYRVGSPFLAALVAEDDRLAALYDASSPATDAQTLGEAVALAIGKRAKKAGYGGDPDLHGRRLATMLLPDLLRYDPERPAGFTFAACNGRHPAEPDSTVVNSILNGFPDGERPVRRPTLQSSFPYFQSLHTTV